MAVIAAALAPKSGDEIVHPNGYVDRTFQVTVANSGATDEWIVTGFSKIVTVVGSTLLAVGAAPAAPTAAPLFKLNSDGTASGATDTSGNLGIQVFDAATILVVTVRGIL